MGEASWGTFGGGASGAAQGFQMGNMVGGPLGGAIGAAAGLGYGSFAGRMIGKAQDDRESAYQQQLQASFIKQIQLQQQMQQLRQWQAEEMGKAQAGERAAFGQALGSMDTGTGAANNAFGMYQNAMLGAQGQSQAAAAPVSEVGATGAQGALAKQYAGRANTRAAQSFAPQALSNAYQNQGYRESTAMRPYDLASLNAQDRMRYVNAKVGQQSGNLSSAAGYNQAALHDSMYSAGQVGQGQQATGQAILGFGQMGAGLASGFGKMGG